MSNLHYVSKEPEKDSYRGKIDLMDFETSFVQFYEHSNGKDDRAAQTIHKIEHARQKKMTGNW